MNLVLFHQCHYLLIRVAQLIEDIAHVFMGSFVLFILFNSLEVPLNSKVIVFFQFMIHTDVVVAGSILGSNLRTFSVPTNGFIILLFRTPIDNTYLVQ